jgi:transcriptional regulator with XRE-family HTH domain
MPNATDTSPDLATLLRRRRAELGITQAALAQQVGVTQSAVAGWESGAALPRPAKVLALADLLGVQVQHLVELMA